MVVSALRASAGWVSMTRLPTPAWMAMTPMLCAIMSCNSRAMRRRSAVMARAVAWLRSASAWARRSRDELPTIQAAIRATAMNATVSPLLLTHPEGAQPFTMPSGGTPAVGSQPPSGGKAKRLSSCAVNAMRAAATDVRRVRVAAT